MSLDSHATFSQGRLGRTGVCVHRLGMRTEATISSDTFEYAMERGINYFYWGWARDQGAFRDHFVQAFRNQSQRRERLVLAIWYFPGPFSTTYEDVLRNLQTDYLDILLLSIEHVNSSAMEAAGKLRRRGVVKWIGVTDRILGQAAPFPETIAKCNRAAAQLLGSPEFDVFQVDFPASVDPVGNTGFWERVPARNAPGIVVTRAVDKWFLESCARVAPEDRPTYEDSYRFALSNPAVSVCLGSAGRKWQLDRALAALERGPLSEEELARMRRCRWAVAHDPKRVYG